MMRKWELIFVNGSEFRGPILTASKCSKLVQKIIIIIIIIFINCNWVVTRWQWLFYTYTNMKERKKK